MLHRVQVTDTSQHQLFRDCVNQAFMCYFTGLMSSLLFYKENKEKALNE